MPRPVFVADRAQLASDMITLAGAEGKHASTVRRISAGERVDVTDGAGLLAECVVTAARPGELDLSVVERRHEPEPACRVVVVQAIMKGDRGELAVQLMTEVGVDVIVPWAAGRCVASWHPDRHGKALARWRATAREAAKQSRRLRFPEVAEQAMQADVLDRVAAASLACVLEHGAPEALAAVALPGSGDIVLVIGPEGGITPAELAALAGAGAVPARLGPTVLRGSSAGAVAAALVLSRCGRWA
jgi:16S rRNA (uracil1498-N3)-methyltransferase